MSAVVALRAVLVEQAAITDLVPTKRIYVGVLPMGTVLPAIALTSISATPRNTASMQEARRLHRERVQITVYAKTYPRLDQIMLALAQSVKNQRMDIAGISVQSIVPAGVGPDFEGVDPVMFIRSADYVVSYLI